MQFSHRLRAALRREAREMLRTGPATVELLRPVGPDVPSDERVLEVPLRSLVAAALAGGAGWAAYGALTVFAHFGPVVATGVAAVVVGLASELFRRGTRIDRHVIILSGIIPLLPGLTAYRGFYQLASAKDVVEGLGTVTLALAIGLAAGVTLGQLVARPRPAPEIPEPGRTQGE